MSICSKSIPSPELGAPGQPSRSTIHPLRATSNTSGSCFAPEGGSFLAPFELTLFSFLDAAGVEQSFTTTDPEAARAHAARHGLVVLRNTYEFVTSEPVADFTGRPAVIADN